MTPERLAGELLAEVKWLKGEVKRLHVEAAQRDLQHLENARQFEALLQENKRLSAEVERLRELVVTQAESLQGEIGRLFAENVDFRMMLLGDNRSILEETGRLRAELAGCREVKRQLAVENADLREGLALIRDDVHGEDAARVAGVILRGLKEGTPR